MDLCVWPLFLRHFPGNDTETKREGKGLFHGLCDKNFFSCIKRKPTIGEGSLFAIYTKILTKVPVCACRKKKCADGYFLFRFLNDCSRGLLSELPWAWMVVNMSYRFYKTPTPYRVFYGRFKRTQMDKCYVICFGWMKKITLHNARKTCNLFASFFISRVYFVVTQASVLASLLSAIFSA